MEALRQQATAKARAVLPQLVQLSEDITRRLESKTPFSDDEFVSLLNHTNALFVTLGNFVQTQKRPQKETNGNHSELITLCQGAVADICTPGYAYIKATGVVRDANARAFLAMRITPLINAYVVFTQNMDDLIQAGTKKESNMY